MHIADHRMSHKTSDALDALADDRRAQMSDMKRLRHVRSTVIDHDRLRLLCLLTAVSSLVRLHLCHIIRQICLIQLEIQKSRLYRFHHGKHGIPGKLLRHFVRDHKRRLLVLLCRRHRSVALIFTEIRSIG